MIPHRAASRAFPDGSRSVVLFWHALVLDAPPSVLGAGVGDLVLLGATLGALAGVRRGNGETVAHLPPPRD